MRKKCLNCSCICPECGKTRDDDIQDTLRAVRDALLAEQGISGYHEDVIDGLLPWFEEGGRFAVREEEE